MRLRPVDLAGSPGSQPKVRTPTHSGQIIILGQKPVTWNLPAFYSPAIAPDGRSRGSGGWNTNIVPTAVMHCAYHRTQGELASCPACPGVYRQFWVMQSHRNRAPPSRRVGLISPKKYWKERSGRTPMHRKPSNRNEQTGGHNYAEGKSSQGKAEWTWGSAEKCCSKQLFNPGLSRHLLAAPAQCKPSRRISQRGQGRLQEQKGKKAPLRLP